MNHNLYISVHNLNGKSFHAIVVTMANDLSIVKSSGPSAVSMGQ